MRESLPVREFVAPLPVAAVAVLTVNDHLLKGAGLLPQWLTGKLSDLAGLFFFPLFLSAVIGVLVGREAGIRRLAAACAATAAGFTALQVSDGFVTVFRAAHLLVGRRVAVTPDPTDLVALPMVLGAFYYGVTRVRRSPAALPRP